MISLILDILNKEYREYHYWGWKATVIKQIANKIPKMKNRIRCHKTSKMSLGNQQTRKRLVDLHQNYILKPIDKARGNVVVIRKIFYFWTLMKEIGITLRNGKNKTYVTFIKAM